jgi:hypothetical protein
LERSAFSVTLAYDRTCAFCRCYSIIRLSSRTMGCKTAGELLDELDGRASGAEVRAPPAAHELGGVIFICRCARAL